MKRDLQDILCCPVCKRSLALSVTMENKTEIISGELRCEACKLNYPIEDGIPNMLPPVPR